MLLLMAGGAAGWNHYFRTPRVVHAPLPDTLISLDSPQGQALLSESDARADYPPLAANFVTQSRRAYCGVASSVMVHNALRDAGPRLDQASFFARAGAGRMAPYRTSLKGMSLRQLARELHAHGLRATPAYASETGMDEFRALATRNLRDPDNFLLVNYQRAALGQDESGHISPVAAYHAGSDRLLILDVAAYRYPSAWVPVEALWHAMRQPLNPKTQRTRGFVEVHEGPAGDVRSAEVVPTRQVAVNAGD